MLDLQQGMIYSIPPPPSKQASFFILLMIKWNLCKFIALHSLNY